MKKLHLIKLIKESYIKLKTTKQCNCGCNSCDNVGNKGVVLNESLNANITMTNNMRLHMQSKLPLHKTTLPVDSKEYHLLLTEARYLYAREVIHLSKEDIDLLYPNKTQMKKLQLKQIIKETLLSRKKCNCGCDTCGDTGNSGITLSENLIKNPTLSENIQYHIDHKLPLTENTFRYGSKAFLDLWDEARSLYVREIIHVNELDKEILTETNLGNYGIYEGKKVPLDIPMLDEGFKDYSGYSESGLNVVPKDQTHANKLKDAIEDSGMYAEWNVREGYFFFPEEENGYDQLEMDIQDLMDENNIQGYIEGVFEESLKESPKPNTDELISILRKLDKAAASMLFKAYKQGQLTSKQVVDIALKTTNINEAEFKGKKVSIGKPKRGGSKAYYVYVKDGDKVKKVSFGSGGLKAKINNPKARQAFAKRHNCANKKDKTTAGYWSCRLPRFANMLGMKTSYTGYW